jgi:hypothetical protein
MPERHPSEAKAQASFCGICGTTEQAAEKGWFSGEMP